MRFVRGCRRRGAIVGTVTLCLAAGWALQSKCARSPSFFLLRAPVALGRAVAACGRWVRRLLCGLSRFSWGPTGRTACHKYLSVFRSCGAAFGSWAAWGVQVFADSSVEGRIFLTFTLQSYMQKNCLYPGIRRHCRDCQLSSGQKQSKRPLNKRRELKTMRAVCSGYQELPSVCLTVIKPFPWPALSLGKAG